MVSFSQDGEGKLERTFTTIMEEASPPDCAAIIAFFFLKYEGKASLIHIQKIPKDPTRSNIQRNEPCIFAADGIGSRAIER